MIEVLNQVPKEVSSWNYLLKGTKEILMPGPKRGIWNYFKLQHTIEIFNKQSSETRHIWSYVNV
jgi:hypothetical protein